MQEQLEEGALPRVEVQASRKPSIVKYLLDRKIKSVVQFRSSMLERVYPVSEAMAAKLLLTGYKYPSSYSKWDPVKVIPVLLCFNMRFLFPSKSLGQR